LPCWAGAMPRPVEASRSDFTQPLALDFVFILK
jgi:hypothetical protein